MSKITDKIFDIVQPLIEAQNLALVEIDYLKEGDNWILKIFIEKPDGDLKLDHCESVSRILSMELDNKDPIDNSYLLEVSSPGLERPLKRKEDYQKNIGNTILIKTYAPYKGQKQFTGKLIDFTEKDVEIKLNNDKGVMKIPFSKIAHSRLTIDF